MQTLRYVPLERLQLARPVDRLSFLADAVRGKTVLDLGAYDESAVALKQDRDRWLHARLAASAKEVTGVDSSAKLPEEGLRTGKNSRIVRGDVMHLEGFSAEVIVAGELIEHLPQPLAFLQAIRAKFPGSQLIVTTPNATAAHNVAIGMFGRESNHHDHLQIYSFKTLSTLFTRAGFSHFELRPYHVEFNEMIARERGPAQWAAWLFERQIQAVEGVFPLLSAGWIVSAEVEP